MVTNGKNSNEECEDSLKNVTNWFFKGSVLRAIIRFSSIRQVELERKIGYSRPKVAKMLQSECVMPKFAKLIAEELEIESPEELQEYYNAIPDKFKEQVKRDGRLKREMKPGVVIPEWELEEARRNGTYTQLLKSRGAL